MEKERKRYLTRRNFLKLSTAAVGVGLLQACSPDAEPTPAPQPTAVKPAAQVPQAPTAVPAQAPTAAPTQAPTAAPTKPAGPKKGGTFTLAYTPTIMEFNPVKLDPGNYAFQRAMFNTLAHYDPQLNLVPELAEKWDFSADGKTVTFKLREGVKYHSGREFTSEDVKASWEFASTDPNTTMRVLFTAIKNVETPDKYTAVFKYDNVYAGVFDTLDTLYIIDKETIADRAKTAVGTGPFKFDKYQPNDRLEMVPFADYWDKGKPHLDRYIIRTIPDAPSMVISLETGAVDAIWQPSYIDLVRLKESGGKYVADMGAPGAQMYNLAINVKEKPFDNKKVRQAMAWALDR
ncbi:MAG: ABC transporter substrate-binding protein, partial [Chloroflexota bacterium]